MHPIKQLSCLIFHSSATMSGEREQTHLLERDVPWANGGKLALIWTSVTAKDNWDVILWLFLSLRCSLWRHLHGLMLRFKKKIKITSYWPPPLPGPANCPSSWAAKPLLSVQKATKSTRWCCDTRNHGKPHIPIINTPSLYYQILIKHLFAAANMKNSFELVQQKKEQIAVLTWI